MLHPTEAYIVPTLSASLGIPVKGIGREIRAGRLRVSRRMGRYWILGEWVLDWIKRGEIVRRLRGDEVNDEVVVCPHCHQTFRPTR